MCRAVGILGRLSEYDLVMGGSERGGGIEMGTTGTSSLPVPGRTLFSPQVRHALDMLRLREEVHGLDIHQTVAALLA